MSRCWTNKVNKCSKLYEIFLNFTRGSDYMKNLATDILRAEKKKAKIWQIATIVVIIVAIAELLIIMN